MNKYSKKSIVLILSLVIVALLAANYVFFYLIRNAGTEVSTLEREVASLRAQVQEFSKYRPEDLKRLSESVMSKIIPRGDFVDFITSIEAQARTRGIEISVDSVNTIPRSDDPNDDKQILYLRLTTQGSWQETMRFITYIEHLPYKISITKLDLAKRSISGTDTGWRAEFEITALKFK